MVDAETPHGVVALLLEDEVPVDNSMRNWPDTRRMTVVVTVGLPVVAALAGGVDTPLDLDLVGGADAVLLIEEVADDPAALALAVLP